MPTVKELYQTSIEREYSYTAHCLHYLLSNRLVKLDDDAERIDYSLIDMDKVREMEDKNYLCFKPIKVYALKISGYMWAFVFAENENDAIEFTKNELKEHPKKCVEYSLDLEMERGNRILSFREMKKDHATFPALVGYYEKDAAYR